MQQQNMTIGNMIFENQNQLTGVKTNVTIVDSLKQKS